MSIEEQNIQKPEELYESREEDSVRLDRCEDELNLLKK